MATGVNRVTLVGYLGDDPAMHYTPNNVAVAKFSLATTEVSTRDDQKKQMTEWHKIIAFGRLAGVCEQYLSKGKQVYIEGKLRTNRWEDKRGNRHSSTEIIISQLVMLGGKSSKDERENDNHSSDAEQSKFDMRELPF